MERQGDTIQSSKSLFAGVLEEYWWEHRS